MGDIRWTGVIVGIVWALAFWRARKAAPGWRDLEFWLWIILVLFASGTAWLEDLVAR